MDSFLFEGRGVWIIVVLLVLVTLGVFGSKIIKLISGVVTIIVAAIAVFIFSSGKIEVNADKFIKENGTKVFEQVAKASDNIKLDKDKQTVKVKLKNKWYDVKDIVAVERGKKSILISIADSGSVKINYDDEALVDLIDILD